MSGAKWPKADWIIIKIWLWKNFMLFATYLACDTFARTHSRWRTNTRSHTNTHMYTPLPWYWLHSFCMLLSLFLHSKSLVQTFYLRTYIEHLSSCIWHRLHKVCLSKLSVNMIRFAWLKFIIGQRSKHTSHNIWTWFGCGFVLLRLCHTFLAGSWYKE